MALSTWILSVTICLVFQSSLSVNCVYFFQRHNVFYYLICLRKDVASRNKTDGVDFIELIA